MVDRRRGGRTNCTHRSRYLRRSPRSRSCHPTTPEPTSISCETKTQQSLVPATSARTETRETNSTLTVVEAPPVVVDVVPVGPPVGLVGGRPPRLGEVLVDLVVQTPHWRVGDANGSSGTRRDKYLFLGHVRKVWGPAFARRGFVSVPEGRTSTDAW